MQQYFDPDTTEYKVRITIKKARRAKKGVGKRSKSKQPIKIEKKNRKQGTCNLHKLPLTALILRINHCCQSIIPSNTNSGFSPWDEVRIPCQKKTWKESFLAIFYEEFPAKISVSRAFLEPWIALCAKPPKPPCFFGHSNLCTLRLL